MTRVPELALSKPEAELYAQACANVARHYDVGASQKTLDHINLITTAMTIYGGRLLILKAKADATRKMNADAARVPGATVTHLHTAPAFTPPGA